MPQRRRGNRIKVLEGEAASDPESNLRFRQEAQIASQIVSAHVVRVHDLGVDVSSEKFAAKALEVNADVVGVSALLTTTMRGQKSVIEAPTKTIPTSRIPSATVNSALGT